MFELAEGGTKSGSGVVVTASSALTYPPFWRGVNLVSRDVGKLPLRVLRRDGEGFLPDTRHPAYTLCRYKSNRYMTANIFRHVVQSRAMSVGNGYAYIVRATSGTKDGDPLELIPLPSEQTYPVRENGVVYYVYDGTPESGTITKIPADDMIHIRDMGDELLGYSVIEKARDSLGLSIGAQRYASMYFSNSAAPSIALEYPARLKPDAINRLRETWERAHKGIENAHRIAVLEEGAKINTYGPSNTEAQNLETRQFGVKEAANWLGIPPHKLADDTKTSYSSLEQENQRYLDEGLDPWLVVWEMELRDKLLRPSEKDKDTHVIEFTRQALLRADLKARGEYYSKAVSIGWMNKDEVRARESMNPIPDDKGKDYYIPVNVTLDGEDEGDEEEPNDDDGPRVYGDLLLSTLRRMAGRVNVSARKLAKDPDTYQEQVEYLHLKHSTVFDEAIRPVFEVLRAAGACTCETHENITRWFFGRARDLLIEASHCDPGGLADSVEGALTLFDNDIEDFSHGTTAHK
jgi:HK97 family phage portal protein